MIELLNIVVFGVVSCCVLELVGDNFKGVYEDGVDVPE